MKIFEKLMKFYLRNRVAKKCEIVSEKFDCICFFSNTALGDTIFNTPVFRAFRAKFGGVKTIALLNPNNAILFKNDLNLDEIITYDGRWSGFLRTLKILKSKKIDICFLLHSNEPQATPLAILSGAKYVFKLPNHKNEFNFLHSNAPRNYADDNRYIVLNRLSQLEFVGIKSADTRLNLYLENSDYRLVDEILAKKDGEKFIGFQMGASSRSRKWTLQRWCELGAMILQNTQHKIVLTGSKSERDETSEFVRELMKSFCENSAGGANLLRENGEFCDEMKFKREFGENDGAKAKYTRKNSDCPGDAKAKFMREFGGRVLNLAGVFSIREAAALIDRLDVLIAPDTGPLHIAAAMRTPTIALFGVANPISSNPNFDVDMHNFIKVNFTLDKNYDKHRDYTELMSKISAREVYEKMEKLL